MDIQIKIEKADYSDMSGKKWPQPTNKIKAAFSGSANQSIIEIIVTRPGFEPRLSEPESDVLPLYDRAMGLQI